jgi:protein TonB
MNAKSIEQGLMELKRPYQRNAMISFGISAALIIMIACTALLFCSKSVDPVKNVPKGDPWPTTIHTIPVPRIAEPPHPQPSGKQSQKLNIGIPKPVPDSQIIEDPEIPSQNQLIDANRSTSIESLGVGILINPDSIGSILPPLDTFIAFETPPVQVILVKPVYPDLARRAGIEGKVWLRVLIDKDGKVREVRVEKSTNPNAGFEESAVAAAWLTVWKPAIANGLPISVPITYAVEFKLK